MKLILGTVQLGLDYGIYKKKPTYKESVEILNYAIESSVFTFDTAQGYGNSEEILSNISHKKDTIIITKIDFENLVTKEEIINKINISLTNLKVSKIDVLLLHNFNDFRNKYLMNILFDLKNIVHKIGVSLYNVEEAIEVLEDDRISILQLPFNYLDRQWDNKIFQEKIKLNNIEIHVRSIFLQGLLVNDFKYWPKINNIKTIYHTIEDITTLYNLTKLELVVSYVNSCKWINKIIFGVDNIEQLKDNIEQFKNSLILDDNQLNYINNSFLNIPNELINPSLWNK